MLAEGVHTDATYCPRLQFPQAVQLGALVAIENPTPARQEPHVVLAEDVHCDCTNDPAPQTSHGIGGLESPRQYEPAGQAVATPESQYWPGNARATQLDALVAPTLDEYVPAGQAWHAPDWFEYVPSGQREQVPLLEMPMPGTAHDQMLIVNGILIEAAVPTPSTVAAVPEPMKRVITPPG